MKTADEMFEKLGYKKKGKEGKGCYIEYIKMTIKREKNAEKNKEYIAGMEDVTNLYEKYFEEDL